jgi:hypothetical protein
MACYAPVMIVRAVGCYEVEAPARTAARVFLLQIELDSAFAAGRPEARRGWPWNDEHGVYWDNTASGWILLPGDTLIGVPDRAAFHTLGLDSIRVRFKGRRDGFEAWLAPASRGYRGLAQ